MARRFRSRNGRVVGRLDAHEVDLLRGLLDDVMTVIGSGDDNAITRRLFPDASPDPEVAKDLKELLYDDLREAKLDAARTMRGSVPDDGRVDLDTDTAEVWLSALNDVRLTIGTSIDVTEETYGVEPDEGDAMLHLYHWLTFLQDTLVEAVSAHGVQR
jgi:hypothetical protein